jgi:hypothetical protein
MVCGADPGEAGADDEDVDAFDGASLRRATA